MRGKALVIGASGQVGRQLLAVLGPDRSVPTSRQGNGKDWLSVDLGVLAGKPDRADELVRAHDIDTVYCVGGMTDVESCESDPEIPMRVNCWGPAALAASAAACGHRFVYFSTEYVFSGHHGPYSEDAPGDPISAYGSSKWKGEMEVRKAHPDSLIVRTTVVYGPDPAGKNFLYALRHALREGRPFRVPADQISTPTYNYDLAQAVVALVNEGKTGVFHVCGPQRLSRQEFATRAAIAMGLNPDYIQGVPTSELRQRAPRPLDAGLATDKLTRMRPDVRMRGVEDSVADWISCAGEQVI